MAADETGQRDLAALVWGLREPPSRGPKPAFNTKRLARAAMALADAEGLEAVSMKRVADELGCTKMALYRYVAGKAELMAVMIEEAVGLPPDLSAVSGGWRPKLEEMARCLASVWEGHPWLPWITAGDRVMGPRELAWTERALEALDGTGLDGRERMGAVTLVFGHVRSTQSVAAAGTQTWTPGVAAALMRDLVSRHADRFPQVAALSGEHGLEETGEFGLQRILDGLEERISR